MDVEAIIATVALLLGAGLLARLIAAALRVPAMLVLLAAGALLGPEGVGALDVPLGSDGAQVLLTLGVSFILFHGGLQLSLRVLSRTAFGLALLVVPGVVLTAAVVGGVAALAFGVPVLTGLLIGAVLAPTDPAILIPLFDRLRMRAKVAQTIVAESALNDPTGAVLALALAVAVLRHDPSLTAPVLEFAADVGVSTALGVGFGVALSLLVSSGRFGVWRESAALAVVFVVAASYVSIDFAGGSGYLGAFLAGLLVGNMHEAGLRMPAHQARELDGVMRTLSDVVVVLVFVVLGANLPFDAIREHLWGALAAVAALVLVARPLTVLACLVPDRRGRWTREELVFLSWTRETGVVPAALAGLLAALGVPGAELVAVTVSLAVVVTLLLQSTTKAWLARRLGLLEPPEEVGPYGGPLVVDDAVPGRVA